MSYVLHSFIIHTSKFFSQSVNFCAHLGGYNWPQLIEISIHQHLMHSYLIQQRYTNFSFCFGLPLRNAIPTVENVVTLHKMLQQYPLE